MKVSVMVQTKGIEQNTSVKKKTPGMAEVTSESNYPFLD
jgi:hypothetical protein